MHIGIMEPYEPPKPENLFLKAILNNIIQIIFGVIVLVALIVNWDSTPSDTKTGVFILSFVYFMIRFSVAYQSHRFEQEIEEQKKGKVEDETYESLLKEG